MDIRNPGGLIAEGMLRVDWENIDVEGGNESRSRSRSVEIRQSEN
jgi:hypothetical protein